MAKRSKENAPATNNVIADGYNKWAQTFRSIGMYHISLDKCCKILAIIYDNGGNESFILSSRFVTDWKTAQNRLYLIGGTEIPSDKIEEVSQGRELLRKYIKELEATYVKGSRTPLEKRYPKWALDIYDEYSLPKIG